MPLISANEVEIYYELAGPDQGEPVVFLSGLTGDHNNWTLQVQTLKDAYRCLTFDWRDTGQSGFGPQAEYTLGDMAADVAGLLTGLGLGRSHLVGLSMGGAVAQEVALNYPELAATLTLASSFSRRLRLVEVPADKRTTGTLRHSAAVGRFDTTARLAGLRLPVLVVAGQRDTSTTPDEQRAYAALIPGARFVLIERAGHLLHLERAGEFNRHLRAFLEEHPL